MPVPTALSEADLKTFMVTELGDVGTALVWTTATVQVVQAVYDAEFILGVSDVSTETNVPKAWAAARLAVWRAAVKSLGSRSDFTADGLTVRHSVLQKQAQEALFLAEAEASEYGVGSAVIRVSRLVRPDPYAIQSDEQLEVFF